MDARSARGFAPHRQLRKFVQIVVAALLASAVVGVLQTPAHADNFGDEQSFLTLTNQDRANNGLGPLSWDESAANIARGWSANLAAAQTLSHNPNLADQITQQDTSQWTRIGENVGFGPTVGGLEQAFMNSAPHRANILGDFNRVGIGVVRDGSGTIWVTVDFVKAPNLPPPGAPYGSLDSVAPGFNGAQVTGWTIDPDTAASINVHVYVDGGFAGQFAANGYRGDVGAAFPGYGPNHGYSVWIGMPSGQHTVCVYGINGAGAGSNSTLGCLTITVNGSPVGSYDKIAQAANTYTITGWTLDPDTKSAVNISISVDGAFVTTVAANKSRPDVGVAFPGWGDFHGFTYTGTLPDGIHTVCATAVNVGQGGNTPLGCKAAWISISPFGSYDGNQLVPGGYRAMGWTIDPSTTSPINVTGYFFNNSVAGTAVADVARPDVANAYKQYGPNHGFAMSVPINSNGDHQVCIYGLNVGPGVNRLLGCTTFTWTGTPFGSLDTVTNVSGGVQVAGWSIDPDTASATTVHAYVDGTFAGAFTASKTRTDVAAYLPDFGSGHGYNNFIAVGRGTHQVCTYAINAARWGTNSLLGCKTITH